MKKLTYTEFRDAMFKFNEEHSDGKSLLYGVIVFTKDSFSANYTEKERSYRKTITFYSSSSFDSTSTKTSLGFEPC